MRLRNALARLALLAVLPALLGACGSLIVTQRSLAYLEGRTGFEWRSRAADGFVVHVEADSATEPDHERILAAAREARGSVLAYLGEPTYEPVVHVFAVDDRARMRALIGRETNAMAYYRSNSLCLVWPRSGRSGVHHELLHVVAMNRWGVPERWVNEGAAVDATGDWLGGDLRDACRRLREAGELPALSRITRGFGRLPSARSYPAAGSFVRYLRETHGRDALRAVWQRGRNALREVTGLGPDELEAAWLRYLDAP